MLHKKTCPAHSATSKLRVMKARFVHVASLGATLALALTIATADTGTTPNANTLSKGKKDIATIAVTPVSGGGTGVTIEPDVNILTLNEGDSFEEKLIVTIPADTAIPLADVYLLADTTGSMAAPINAVKAGAIDIVNTISTLPGLDVQFGVGDFKDFQSPVQFDPYAFRHQQSITANSADVISAINAWFASGGEDIPEGQFYAYDQIAQDRAPSNVGSPPGTIGWRPGTKKILVVFGDAAAHDPICSDITFQVNGHGVAYDIDEALVTNRLVTEQITFLGVSTTTGLLLGMDADPLVFGGNYVSACGFEGGTSGQATRLATATGGDHLIDVPTAEVVDAIIDLITVAVTTINNLALVPKGGTSPFVTSIDPASYGPLDLDEEHLLNFDVTFTGVVACADEDQVFTGSINVVGDGSVLTQKDVTITVPACEEPPVIDGRMTGGGSVFTVDGVRVTHGFVLQCDADDHPNNLQINWGQGPNRGRFHLMELTTALCYMDPDFIPDPPSASFNTYEGTGMGRLNNQPGATAHWTFTDAGQPGVNDEAHITIWAPGDVPGVDAPVLEVSGTLQNGNHQAHDN